MHYMYCFLDCSFDRLGAYKDYLEDNAISVKLFYVFTILYKLLTNYSVYLLIAFSDWHYNADLLTAYDVYLVMHLSSCYWLSVISVPPILGQCYRQCLKYMSLYPN